MRMDNYSQESMGKIIGQLETNPKACLQMVRKVAREGSSESVDTLNSEFAAFIKTRGEEPFLRFIDNIDDKDPTKFKVVELFRERLPEKLGSEDISKKVVKNLKDELEYHALKTIIPDFIPESSFHLWDCKKEPADLFKECYKTANIKAWKDEREVQQIFLLGLRSILFNGHNARLRRFAAKGDFRRAETEFKAMVSLIEAITLAGDYYGDLEVYLEGFLTFVHMYERLEHYESAEQYALALLDSVNQLSDNMRPETALFLKLGAQRVLIDCLYNKKDIRSAYKMTRRAWNMGNANFDLIKNDPMSRLSLAQIMYRLNKMHSELYGKVERKNLDNCLRLYKTLFMVMDELEVYSGFTLCLYDLYLNQVDVSDIVKSNLKHINSSLQGLEHEARLDGYSSMEVDFDLIFLGTLLGKFFEEMNDYTRAKKFFELAFKVNKKMAAQHLEIGDQTLELLAAAGMSLTRIKRKEGSPDALTYARLTEQYLRILMEREPPDLEYRRQYETLRKCIIELRNA